jgi:molybdopterin molybdotransferase
MLPSDIKQDSFIRMAGEDIKKGTVYLHKGEVINAYTIASLASQGITHIAVTRQIKVAIFGTGDELRPHYEKIETHQLYNSNSPMFLTRSEALGCNVRFIPTSADTLEALEVSITSTLDADIIITSGGVSVGDKDFTKEAFINLGMQVHIDKIDIKPGRPTIVGSIGKTVVVNLPGNPLAAMINYELFVRAIIRKMSGRTEHYHTSISTTMANDFSVRGGKYAVVLGTFDGTSFKALKSQMPGMVSPMQKADGLLLITPDVKLLKQDAKVKMIPIKWEFGSAKKEELFTY